MAYEVHKTVEIGGIPSAPLIGEHLSAIDFDWRKIREQLDKEFPMLTLEELERTKNDLPDEMVIARLMLMGYFESANEINKLVREDAKERLGKKKRKHCLKKMELGKDKKKLKLLATVFAECENIERIGGWNEIILSRMELAKTLVSKKDFWLAEKVVQNCFDYSIKLNQENDLEDRYLLADLNLTMAFLLLENHGEKKQSAIIKLLKNCRQLTHEMQDKKFIRYRKANRDVGSGGCNIVKFKLDRPAKLHGWTLESQCCEEVVSANHDTIFHTASILLSILLVKQAQKNVSYSYELENEAKCDLEKMIEESYRRAFKLACQGQNHTNIITVLYSYGQYLIEKGLLETAHNTFLDLHFKCLNYDDYESLGISFNCLSYVSNAKNIVEDALGHLCEEWEIGCNHNFPALIVDSTRDIGRILLEEGQLLNAKLVCRESFDKHMDLKLKIEEEKESKTDENEVDEAYDHSWAMAGIAGGLSHWGRLAGHSRNGAIINLLEWQTSRIPFPPVVLKDMKPKTIVEESKHCDVQYMGRKMSEKQKIEMEERNVVNPTSPQALYDMWIQSIEDEDFEFEHDIIDGTRRARVMAKSARINKSMSVAMEQNDNLLRNQSKLTSVDGRSSHMARKIISKILLHQQRIKIAEEEEANKNLD